MSKENLTAPLNEVKLEGRIGFDPITRVMPQTKTLPRKDGGYKTSFKFSIRLPYKNDDGTWGYHYENYSVEVFYHNEEEYSWLKKGLIVAIEGKFCVTRFKNRKTNEWILYKYIKASSVEEVGRDVIADSKGTSLTLDLPIYNDDDIPF